MADQTEAEAGARQLEEAQAGLRAMTAAREERRRLVDDEAEVPAVNPYFGDDEIRMTHRVFETFTRELADYREQLVAQGWRRGQATQSQLLMAIMHKAWPRNADEAAKLLREWNLVQAAPPPRRAA